MPSSAHAGPAVRYDVMRCVQEHPGATGMQICQYLKGRWHESTVATTLRLLAAEERFAQVKRAGRSFAYWAFPPQNFASSAQKGTESSVSRPSNATIAPCGTELSIANLNSGSASPIAKKLENLDLLLTFPIQDKQSVTLDLAAARQLYAILKALFE